MMEFDLFAFLDGASAWWWIALALALGAIEIVTFTYFMLWLGMAAATVGIALWAVPEMSGSTQILIFALTAILYTAAGYYYVRNRKDPSLESGLNQRSAAVVGREAVISAPFSAGVGWVEVDGVRWRARLAHGTPEPTAGDVMHVSGAEGMTLELSRAE